MQTKVSTTHATQTALIDDAPVKPQLVTDDSKLSRIRKFVSATLFEGASEVAITHQDETYFLRITKQNKLILTK